MSKIISLVTEEKYTLVRKLGSGSFASVNHYRDNDNNDDVAIKHIYVQRAFLDEVKPEV